MIYTASSPTGTGLLTEGTTGELVTLSFTVAAGAAAGSTEVNLRHSYNVAEGAAYDDELEPLLLAPAPTNAATDSVDGRVTIRPDLVVNSLTPTSTGFRVRFTQDLNAESLNLYGEGGTLGPPDVTLVGTALGAVRGSFVVGPGLREVDVHQDRRHAGAGQYTVTLKRRHGVPDNQR